MFARKYVMSCEDRYGIDAVEAVLDSCHALSHHGVDRYKRPTPISYKEEAARQAERQEHARLQYNDLWRTLPRLEEDKDTHSQSSTFPPEPEENLLYFIEKYSPKLAPWQQKELVRIVRKIAQYFYPQTQTKVMNEGWATFWHYTILNRLHEKGLVNDGFMMEFLQSHTNVVSQRLRRARLRRHQSVCAGIRDDVGHPSHLRGAHAGRPPLVPRHRRRRLAEDAGLRHAQLQGRVLHLAVPVAQADP